MTSDFAEWHTRASYIHCINQSNCKIPVKIPLWSGPIFSYGLYWMYIYIHTYSIKKQKQIYFQINLP